MKEVLSFHIPSGILDSESFDVDDGDVLEQRLSSSGVNPKANEFRPSDYSRQSDVSDFLASDFRPSDVSEADDWRLSTESVPQRLQWNEEPLQARRAVARSLLRRKKSATTVYPLGDNKKKTSKLSLNTENTSPTTDSPKSPSRARRLRRKELERNLAAERDRKAREVFEAAKAADDAARLMLAETQALLRRQQHKANAQLQQRKNEDNSARGEHKTVFSKKQEEETASSSEIIMSRKFFFLEPVTWLCVCLPPFVSLFLTFPTALWFSAVLLVLPCARVYVAFLRCAAVATALEYGLRGNDLQAVDGPRLMILALVVAALMHSSSLPHPVAFATAALQIAARHLLGDTSALHYFQLLSSLAALRRVRHLEQQQRDTKSHDNTHLRGKKNQA